jgi:hypothetical protein
MGMKEWKRLVGHYHKLSILTKVLVNIIMFQNTSGIYLSKFAIRRNPFQVNMFLITEDYPLLKINQFIQVTSKIYPSGQNRETGVAEMLRRTGLRVWRVLLSCGNLVPRWWRTIDIRTRLKKRYRVDVFF